jgi:hypothetical protein
MDETGVTEEAGTVLLTVTICRPPLAVASSEYAIDPADVVVLMSTCTEPPERRAASVP